MPSISVVIPAYNRAALLGRAVRSVLAQIEPGDEIVVVDDESTDDTAAVVAAFGAPVRYVRNVHRGLGCGSARNRGVDEADRPLIAFLDSDDEWLPGKLPLQRAFMAARPDIIFCFTDFECRCDDGRVWHNGLFGWHGDTRGWDEILAPARPYSSFAPLPAGVRDVPVHIGDLYRPMLQTNYVATQSTLVRRAAAGSGFRFAEDVPIHEEYEGYARLARHGPTAYFASETFIQWGHAGQRVSRDADELRRSMSRLRILPRVWGVDSEFLSLHGSAYERAVTDERLILARLLIGEGRTREARTALRGLVEAPLTYRMFALLPGVLARGVHRTLRAMNGLRRRKGTHRPLDGDTTGIDTQAEPEQSSRPETVYGK